MSQENMKNQLAAQEFLCPLCGNKGKSVKRITIESLLTDEAKAGLVDMDGFRFCPTPTCQISYFHPEIGKRFLCRDVRVRIGQKQTQAPRPTCYCFNHTIEEIEEDVAKTGTSGIPEAITEKCRKGLARCEQTSPNFSHRLLNRENKKYFLACWAEMGCCHSKSFMVQTYPIAWHIWYAIIPACI